MLPPLHMCFLKAQQRAGKKVIMIPKRPASTVLNEGMVPDLSDCPNTVSMHTQCVVASLCYVVIT